MQEALKPHRLFVAGDRLADCPERELLVRAGFTSNGSLTGVGLLWTADGLIVVLPKAYASCRTPPSVDRVFLLLRLLKRIQLRDQARKEKGTQIRVGSSSYPEEWARGRLVSPSLEALLRAIRDVQRDLSVNGLYLRRRSAQVRNDFRYPVDWQQTLAASLPRLDRQGVEFPETRHRGRAFDFQHPIRQLQSEALRRASALLGEVDPVRDEPSLDPGLKQRLEHNHQALFRELRSDTFDERSLRLLDALQRYFSQAGEFQSPSGREPDGASLWTPHFEHIWEMLVREVLAPHTLPDIPRGHWEDYPGADKVGGIQPRVDAFYRVGGLGVLIDAKDKRDKDLERKDQPVGLGSANDHYKQVIYKQLGALKSSTGIDHNLLVFPAVGPDTQFLDRSQVFRIRGRHYWPDRPDSLVTEVDANYELLARAWLGEIRLGVSDAWAELLPLLKDWGSATTLSSTATSP